MAVTVPQYANIVYWPRVSAHINDFTVKKIGEV